MLPHQSDTLSVSDACRYLSPLSQTKIVAWSEQVGKPHPKFKRQPLASINANSSSSPSKRLRTDSEEMDNEQSPSKSIKRTTSPVKPSGRLTRASTRLETAQAEPIHEDNVSRQHCSVAVISDCHWPLERSKMMSTTCSPLHDPPSPWCRRSHACRHLHTHQWDFRRQTNLQSRHRPVRQAWLVHQRSQTHLLKPAEHHRLARRGGRSKALSLKVP